MYEDFPVNRELIWLNNCGTTPASRVVTEVMKRYFEAYAREGVLMKDFSLPETQDSIQRILAGLFNCERDEVAIIHNTAEGMNLISHGLDLKAGDEILLLQDEYPSNVYPWQHWLEKGVIINVIPMTTTPDEFPEEMLKKITGNTRVISLSAVHWCTGMPLPLSEISRICNKKGIVLAVDGAQGVGHVAMTTEGVGMGLCCFSAWKWLLGPVGLGAMIVTSEKLSQLHPVFTGTGSVVDSHQYLPYQNTIKPTAERYIYSTPNFNDWIYFETSLTYLESLGFDRVRKRIYELADYLTVRLKKIGCRPLSDSFPDSKTGIVVVEKDGVNFGDIVQQLRTRGIIVCERLGRLRLAPHIYNSFEQLDTTVKAIKELI